MPARINLQDPSFFRNPLYNLLITICPKTRTLVGCVMASCSQWFFYELLLYRRALLELGPYDHIQNLKLVECLEALGQGPQSLKQALGG